MVVTWDPLVIFIFIRGCELIEDPGDCMVIRGRKSRLGVMVTMGIGGSVRGMADKVGGGTVGERSRLTVHGYTATVTIVTVIGGKNLATSAEHGHVSRISPRQQNIATSAEHRHVSRLG